MNAHLSADSSLAQEAKSLSKTERREYLVGVLAAVFLAAVLVFTAMANRGHKADTGAFTLNASFHRADGIHVGSQVRVAGMNIGTVTKSVLGDDQEAVLTFSLTNPVALPDDTAAKIETDGFFGGKYIELIPGGTEDMLKSGAHMSYTQDAVIIEDLVALIIQRAKDAHAKPTPTPNEQTPREQKP